MAPLTFRSLRTRLVIFVAAALTAIWGAAGYHLWHLRVDRLADAERQAQSLAVAMEEYVRRTLQAADLALRGHAAAVARLNRSPEETAGEVQKLLGAGDSAFARAFALAVFDRQGHGVAASTAGMNRTLGYADRDYFQVHLKEANHGLFVGEPLVGRTHGKQFFALSRRIEDERGGFRGVIMSSVDAAYLADYFRANLVGAKGSIALLHVPSRRVIARVPDFDRYFGMDASRLEVFQRDTERYPDGISRIDSRMDGIPRIYAYRRVEGFPLIVAVGIAEGDILDEPHGGASSLLLAIGGATLILVAAAGALLRTQRRLVEAQDITRRMFDIAPVGIALYDAEDGRCLSANLAMADAVGSSREALLAQNYYRIESWKAAGLLDAARRAVTKNVPQRIEAHFRTTFGREVWVETMFVPFSDGRDLRLMVLANDRTEARQAESELLLARQVIESSTEAIVITDVDNRIVSVNSAFETITGYTAAEALGQNPRILASGKHDQAFYQAMWEAILSRGRWEGEIWERRKNGEIYPKWLRINVLRDADGKLTNFVAGFSDITERKAAEATIHHLAHHDPLTDLPNRFALRVHLERAFAFGRRQGESVAIMFIDLDRFKNINDSLGHHVGDQLLCQVAARLKGAVRDADLVARLGGDEFVVVLEGLHHPEDVAGVARKILDAVGQPYAIEGRELHTTPSVGVSFFPQDGDDMDIIMRNADTAMYHAKTVGRNNVQYYAERMNAAAQARLATETALRTAIREEQFVLYYQPQFKLGDGRLAGMEALIRWRHPQRGLVPPAEFIPVAEETGLIVEIGEWVLAEACRQARAWEAAGLDYGRVAVNISAQHFQRSSLETSVARALADTGLAAARLELEITETAVMASAEESRLMLERLNAMGIQLAIDDFGTGYSSLSYLKRFPVSLLKIDRSFVLDIERDASDAAIAAAVIALAHSIGLAVVAEGVETEGQAAFLRERGCDYVQGYLYAKPLPADEAGRFIGR